MSASCCSLSSCLRKSTARHRRRQEKASMGEAKHKNSFRYVPEEIVHSILHNLPDNSVLRFRCVSKQWRGWISGVKIPMQKLVVVFNIPLKIIDQTPKVTNIDHNHLSPMNITSLKPHFTVSLLGSWEGVLLVRVYNDLFLWNPSSNPSSRHVLSMRQWETLIEPRPDSLNVIASGLCFDNVNGELKAVMSFSSVHNHGNVVVMVGLETKVIEVIDFPYKFVSYGTRPFYSYSLRSGPVVNDKLHWYIHYSPSAPQQHLLAFDPNAADDVKFTDLPLPEGNYYKILGLGVLDGCLCMTSQRVANDDPIEVMGMKEYGAKVSWEILFRLRRWYSYYKSLVPLFYTKNKNEVLFKGTGIIFTYNTKSRTFKEICISDLRHDSVMVYQGYLDQQ